MRPIIIREMISWISSFGIKCVKPGRNRSTSRRSSGSMREALYSLWISVRFLEMRLTTPSKPVTSCRRACGWSRQRPPVYTICWWSLLRTTRCWNCPPTAGPAKRIPFCMVSGLRISGGLQRNTMVSVQLSLRTGNSYSRSWSRFRFRFYVVDVRLSIWYGRNGRSAYNELIQ